MTEGCESLLVSYFLLYTIFGWYKIHPALLFWCVKLCHFAAKCCEVNCLLTFLCTFLIILGQHAGIAEARIYNVRTAPHSATFLHFWAKAPLQDRESSL